MSKKRQTNKSTPKQPVESGGGASARQFPAWLAPLCVAALLLLLAFAGTSKVLVSPHLVFSFNDGNIESALGPAYRYPGVLLRVWDSQSFFGKGSTGAPPSISNLLNAVSGPHGFRRQGVMLSIWLTGLAIYWAFRLWGRSRPASLLASVLVMLCGWSFTFPTVGLPVRSFTLACAALSLGWVKRGIRRSDWLSYIIAGGFLGLAVTDTADVGILFSVCCAGVFVFLHLTQVDNAFRPAALLRSGAKMTIYVVVSLLLAYQTIGLQVSTNIKGVSQGAAQSPEERYAWATQWSLPKAETWSLFACDYHGASSRSDKSPYWGGMGRSKGWEKTRQGFRNFRLAGYAVGVVPVVFLALLFAVLLRKAPKRRRFLDDTDQHECWCFTILMLMSLMLSWGHHFPLYRLFYALPYMGTIRNPDKWLGPFTLFLAFIFAMSVDLVLRLGRDDNRDERRSVLKWGTIITTIVPAIALTGLVYLNTSRGAFTERLKSEGYGNGSVIAWENAVQANVQVVIVLAMTSVLLWIYLSRRKKVTFLATSALITCTAALLAVELLKADEPFVIGHDYQHVLRGNAMTTYLDEHKNHGRVKVLPPQNPLLNNWRNTYLTARGYDLFDPVSAPRIPKDYEALFGAVGGDIARLWGLGAVRYIVCPTQLVPQLQQLSRTGAQFVSRLAFGVSQVSGGHWVPDANVPENQKGLSIVEYTGARPFIGLIHTWDVYPDSPGSDLQVLKRLTAADFDWQTTVLVSGEIEAKQPGAGEGNVEIISRSPTEVRAGVNSSQAALLVHASRYDPYWRVSIDGSPVELLRVNYLFQGIRVESGKHEVLFEYRPPLKPLLVSIGGRLGLIGCLAMAAFTHRRKRLSEENTDHL